jgi:hypothetical protein
MENKKWLKPPTSWDTSFFLVGSQIIVNWERETAAETSLELICQPGCSNVK